MAKFDLKKAILENKATFFGSLTEGQFSWMTQDTGQQIGSQDENKIPVYMFDNKGKYYYENDYDGYGEFGGKDYYDLVAEMNGYTADDAEKFGGTFGKLRGIGIKLAFGELEPKNGGPVLFPALVTKPDKFNYKSHNFAVEAETDPNQSWYEPEEDEEDNSFDLDDDEDYGYNDEDEEELDENKEIKPTTKMKKSELKAKIKEMIVAEYERDVDYTDETAGYDFLAELEGMLNEASEFDMNKPARIKEFIIALNRLVDEYHSELYLNDDLFAAISMVIKAAQEEAMNLSEADETEKDTAEVDTTDVAVDDTETIDTETEVEVDPNVKAVQDALTQAQVAAQKLGDPKLTDQIGNTITFFTREHVVEKPKSAVAENINEMAGKTLEITKPEDLKKVEGSQIFKYDVFDREEFEKYKVYILADDKSQAEKIAKEKFPKQFPPYTLDVGYPQKSNAAENLWTGKEKMSFWYGVEKTETTAENINEVMFPMLKKILK